MVVYLPEGDILNVEDGNNNIQEYMETGLPSGVLWASIDVESNKPILSCYVGETKLILCL